MTESVAARCRRFHRDTGAPTYKLAADELDALAARLAEAIDRAVIADARLANALAVCDEQANDDGIWFIAGTAPEAYLQAALRRLHAAVEGTTDSASPHHWQCQRCGTMNTEPYCPCAFEPAETVSAGEVTE